MAGTRRMRGKQQRRHLQAVPNGADARDDAVMQLLDELAAAGAPEEVLRALTDAEDPAEVLQGLVEAGRLPTPEASFARLVGGFSPLLDAGTDPLTAELAGAEFLGLVRRLAEDEADLPEMLRVLIGQAEECRLPEALAMLRVLAVVGPDEIRAETGEAANRMIGSGLRDCSWVDGLGAPKVGRCFGYGDDFGEQESIAVTFRYGRRQHAVVVLIDHVLGGGVKDCFVTDQVRRIRSQFEALTARAGIELFDYEPEHAHLILGRALSEPPCPVQPDQIEDVGSYLDLVRSRVASLAAPKVSERSPRRHSAPPTVHRLKVTLRGAKPPIWRRLEVPSTATLEQVHDIIQRTFGWYGCHLWVFDTPSGEFGVPDPELGHGSAKGKTLAQVAQSKGAKIRYTYDFGDDWQHEIQVEDVVPADPGVAYPRCVTGRRACPPEDCGGVGGYAALLDTLADPGDDEHRAMLDWLGMDSADEFDPAEFSPSDVNASLADIARVLAKG